MIFLSDSVKDGNFDFLLFFMRKEEEFKEEFKSYHLIWNEEEVTPQEVHQDHLSLQSSHKSRLLSIHDVREDEDDDE